MMSVERESNPVAFWHYLSFADERGFLGVCWVKARGLIDACQIARKRGCNPGGEVMCLGLPKHGEPPDGTAYVLHTDKDEIDRLCDQWKQTTRPLE